MTKNSKGPLFISSCLSVITLDNDQRHVIIEMNMK